MIVKARLGSPANMEGAGDMALGPFHDFAELRPVIHLFKGDLFHGRPCDNKAVVLIRFQFIKGIIKFIQMRGRCIQRGMAVHLHESHINLQRRIRQGAQELKLRILLHRHQIQDAD